MPLVGKKPVAKVKDKLFKACSPSSEIPTEVSKQFGAYEWVMSVVEIASAWTPRVGFTKTRSCTMSLLMTCFSHRLNKVAQTQEWQTSDVNFYVFTSNHQNKSRKHPQKHPQLDIRLMESIYFSFFFLQSCCIHARWDIHSYTAFSRDVWYYYLAEKVTIPVKTPESCFNYY